jgi:hypothetical protein
VFKLKSPARLGGKLFSQVEIARSSWREGKAVITSHFYLPYYLSHHHHHHHHHHQHPTITMVDDTDAPVLLSLRRIPQPSLLGLIDT